MKQRIVAALLVAFSATVVLYAQSRGTPNNLRVNVDANGYLVTSSAVQTLPITGVRFSDARLAVDASGNLLTTAGGSSSFLPTVIGGSTASSSLTLQSTTGVGTTDSILFKVGNNGGTLCCTIATTGFMLFGTASTQTGYGTQPLYPLHVITTNAGGYDVDRISADAVGAVFLGRHARGTINALGQTVNNDNLVTIQSSGWETTTPTWTSGANGQFGIQATESYTSSAQGTRFILNLTPNGSTTPARLLTGSAAGLAFSQVSGTAMAVANVGANSCGTTAATIAGNQTVGEVTVGATSGTQCRVTVPQATTTRFNGSCSNQTTANLCRLVAVSTTTFDLVGTFVAGDVVAYAVFSR